MEFLRRELDDPQAEPCGRCMNCTGDRLEIHVDDGVRLEALEHLRGSTLFIEPRLQWPSNLGEPKGRIPEGERLEPGRALSVYGDGGWGRLVREGRQEHEHFSDELVAAAATMIADSWQPEPSPAWVTCVPSMVHPNLVPDFAARLAAALGLPFREVVTKVAENQPQTLMENSAQQLRNVLEAFEITGEVPAAEPVLLVDDISDSRWTMTVIGRSLRLAGSGPVFPFALATAVGA